MNKINNKINEVMTFSEASEKWGISISTLRMMARTNRAIEGVDIRKSGKVWLITIDAMKRLYGEEKE